VAAIMMRAVKQPDTAVTVIPIQVNVHAGGPMERTKGAFSRRVA